MSYNGDFVVEMDTHFPKLRAGVFETSAGWMPWLVERLDESYEANPQLTPHLQRKPSEVIAEGRLFHAVESGEEHLDHCVKVLGDDIWLFATDYPHTGSPWPHGVQDIADRSELSEARKAKMLGQNALRLCPRIKGCGRTERPGW